MQPSAAAGALLLPLLLVVHAQQPQALPCVADCLAEATASAPNLTKGCPAGTEWTPWPRTDPTSACRPCTPGFFCPGIPFGDRPDLKVNLNRRVACPTGTYLNTSGASNVSDCLDCPMGFYQDWVGQTACIGCPVGRFVTFAGASSVHDCEACPCGHYCPGVGLLATPCTPGSYTRNTGMVEEDSCTPCPPGTACPPSTCDPLCYQCPPGRWSNETGVSAAGANCTFHDVPCNLCLLGFFCPLGSVVPTACPAGTWAGNGTPAEADCADCPVGYRCVAPALAWTKHSLVHRDAHGFPMVGSAAPELCEVDVTPVHYSYPDHQGCEEGCPFELPRQSFCHVAGDGRIPDRDRASLMVGDLVTRRAAGFRTAAAQDRALARLSEELANMTEPDRRSVLSLPDKNGRTPLLMAAMMGDVPLLEVLWWSGANATAATTARDLEGFTALMQALRFEHTSATAWLAGVAKASLSEHDASVLEGLGVDLAGVPVAQLQLAPEYLGGGGITWTHPSGEDFMIAPEAPAGRVGQ